MYQYVFSASEILVVGSLLKFPHSRSPAAAAGLILHAFFHLLFGREGMIIPNESGRNQTSNAMYVAMIPPEILSDETVSE
jgi:hypothetical protein